jgi:hypothetical protein
MARVIIGRKDVDNSKKVFKNCVVVAQHIQDNSFVIAVLGATYPSSAVYIVRDIPCDDTFHDEVKYVARSTFEGDYRIIRKINRLEID